jgi:hypothetical protein
VVLRDFTGLSFHNMSARADSARYCSVRAEEALNLLNPHTDRLRLYDPGSFYSQAGNRPNTAG